MDQLQDEIISITAKQAYAFLDEHPEAELIDIRSAMEFTFVGHPIGATNIAWIDGSEWKVILEFPENLFDFLQKKYPQHPNPKELPVVLICRSGVRTLDAGAMLMEEGFTQVVHINEGFEGEIDDNKHRGNIGGWRYHDLPWEQG